MDHNNKKPISSKNGKSLAPSAIGGSSMTSFDWSNWSMAEKENPFRKSLSVQRTPPDTPRRISEASEEETHSITSGDNGKVAATQQLQISEEVNEPLFCLDNLQIMPKALIGVLDNVEEKEHGANVSSAVGSKQPLMDRREQYEEALFHKCKAIFKVIKDGFGIQKNIRADVKLGVSELEEVIDAIWHIRARLPQPHAQMTFTTPIRQCTQQGKQTHEQGSQKRPATSPADQAKQQEKKPRDETTPNGFLRQLSKRERVARKRAEKAIEQRDDDGPQRPPPRNADNKEKTGKRHRRLRKPRAEAVLIKPAEGKSYADVLKEIRSKVNPEETETEISAIRQTRTGDVLLELGPKTKDKQGLCGALRGALGDGAKVVSLNPMASLVSLEIRDLDGYTERDEVKEALERELPQAGATRIALFAAPRGQKVAILDIEERWALKLLDTGRIKIGWVFCRVQRRAVVTRCYKCQGFGHVARGCNGPDRSRLCYKCMGEGHKKSQCTAESHCDLCLERDSDAGVDHTPGSGRCRVYREALQAAKNRL